MLTSTGDTNGVERSRPLITKAYPILSYPISYMVLDHNEV